MKYKKPKTLKIKRSGWSDIVASVYVDNELPENIEIVELYSEQTSTNHCGFIDLWEPKHARRIASWLNQWADWIEGQK